MWADLGLGILRVMYNDRLRCLMQVAPSVPDSAPPKTETDKDNEQRRNEEARRPHPDFGVVGHRHGGEVERRVDVVKPGCVHLRRSRAMGHDGRRLRLITKIHGRV